MNNVVRMMTVMALMIITLNTYFIEVKEGDTLDSIASLYFKPRTTDPREFLEFREGIVVLNYEVLKHYPDFEPRPDDVLEIHVYEESK